MRDKRRNRQRPRQSRPRRDRPRQSRPRRAALFHAVVILSILLLSSCAKPSPGRSIGSDDRPAETKILKLVTLNQHGVSGIYRAAERFHATNPEYSVEISAIPVVSTFNSYIASKFAVGDVPDLLIYQYGSNTSLYAGGGHLLDLTDTGLIDRFKPGLDKFSRHGGRVYALPVDMTVTGLFVNMSSLWRAGIRVLPDTFDEFLETCETLRRSGLDYPVVIGAKEDSAAAAFVFQYMYQNMYQGNPDFYRSLVRGDRKWDGPDFLRMYADYGRLRLYADPAWLQYDSLEAVRRFTEGSAAFMVGGSYNIADIRRFSPALDMMLISPPWVREKSALISVSDGDTVISGTARSPYPEAVKAFLSEFTTVESGNDYSAAMRSVSAVKGTSVAFDQCLLGQLPFLEGGRRIGFLSREWVPEIKEEMKKLNQEWFAGKAAAELLAAVETEHRRLISLHSAYAATILEGN